MTTPDDCTRGQAVPLVDVDRASRAVVCTCGARWPRADQVPAYVALRLDALLGADAWRGLARLTGHSYPEPVQT
jgi:hypothetical protein